MGVGDKDILASGRIHLVREVLDSQLLDCNQFPMGRVDGLVAVLRGDAPPELVRIESGMGIAAARLSKRLGRWIRAIGRRCGERGGEPVCVPWSNVRKIGPEVELDLLADQTHALAWEQWLCHEVIGRIPLSGRPSNHPAARHRAHFPTSESVEQRHARGEVEVRLELLLSRTVLDPAGQSAGRIEEFVAERSGERWIIREFLLGREALIERLSVVDFAHAFVRSLGSSKGRPSHRLAWQDMDLADPHHPRLRRPAREIQAIDEAQAR